MRDEERPGSCARSPGGADTARVSFTFWKLVRVADRENTDGLPEYLAAPYVTLYDGMFEVHLSPGQAAGVFGDGRRERT